MNTFSVCAMVSIGFTFIWFSKLCVGNSWMMCMSSYISLWILKSRRKTREPKEENVTLGPATREGEQVFGVAHIFASFNDTFIVSTNYCICSFIFLVIDLYYFFDRLIIFQFNQIKCFCLNRSM